MTAAAASPSRPLVVVVVVLLLFVISPSKTPAVQGGWFSIFFKIINYVSLWEIGGRRKKKACKQHNSTVAVK
jgi:hypothetical protein